MITKPNNKKTRTKFDAKKELAYMGTTLGGEGVISLELGFENNVEEVVDSFHAYNKQISDLASQTLVVINKALVDGYSEKEILATFNKKFKHVPYKSMKELINHYQTIAI